jgi:hypothetical protein
MKLSYLQYRASASPGSCRKGLHLRGSLRSRFVIALFGVLLLHGALPIRVCAAPAVSLKVDSIQIKPDTVISGQYPDITAFIRMTSTDRTRKSLQVNVVATVTQPNNVMRSWQWKKVKIGRGETKKYILPKEYDTRHAGIYKVEYVIYSSDMKRRLSRLSRRFTVAEQPKPPAPAVPQPQKEMKGLPAYPKGQVSRPAQERTYLGIGIYANALNPAAGATVLFWPLRNVGLQGSYTVGTFTSYEGRLLVKIELPAGFNPYLGLGYVHVSKTSNIIGIETTFTDSSVSGVLGVEIPLGKSWRGYLEVSGAKIDLEKVVTNGSQTALATVDYAPVTIGVGLVYSLF